MFRKSVFLESTGFYYQTAMITVNFSIVDWYFTLIWYTQYNVSHWSVFIVMITKIFVSTTNSVFVSQNSTYFTPPQALQCQVSGYFLSVWFKQVYSWLLLPDPLTRSLRFEASVSLIRLVRPQLRVYMSSSVVQSIVERSMKGLTVKWCRLHRCVWVHVYGCVCLCVRVL